MIACDACGARCDTPRPRSQTRRKCSRCQGAQEGQNTDHERTPGDHLWFVPRWDLWFAMPARERAIYMANGIGPR